MQRLKVLMIAFFSFFFISEMKSHTAGDSVQAISMRIDSVYRPFEDFEKVPSLKDKFANIVIIRYGYYKGGERTGYFIVVEMELGFSPYTLEIDYNNEGWKGNLSLEDIMSGLNFVLSDIKSKYGLRRFYDVWIYPPCYGDESIEISKKYEDRVRGDKYDGGLLGELYGESRMLKGIKDILALYGKVFDNFVFEKVFYFTSDEKDLPKKILYPEYIRLSFHDKDEEN
ncbi:hypothetical protein [Xylanibacter muris]|uniref:Uncharacterized protein n=2 Tax=Xylanibacter muris TaxID=2736290 RepID=A0ABX2API0_9BACT|nr:hypothetical protein [Xylanibacter muris]NPD93050.1 hypothetical protein [Xylanibacter muris]